MPSSSAKYVTTGETCAACGADVRAGSLYCYNCGKGISGSAQELTAHSTPIPKPKGKAAEFTRKVETPNRPAAGATIESEGNGSPPKALKTAAAIKAGKRKTALGPINVRWTEPESGPALFYIAAIMIPLLTALLVALALYLK